MTKYRFRVIEKKWQNYWEKAGTFYATENRKKPKYYVLDMFPYPSGSGLHVGHPLGYIASDIFSRFKKNEGYEVLHPMGFDAFGLPAEQYAIETGQHPADTTRENIANFKRQLKKIGLAYDWQREVRTSDPRFYQWTQWIFLKLFDSWYNISSGKAEPIDSLIKAFEEKGNTKIKAACDEDVPGFSAGEWKSKTEKQQQTILQKYRLAYLAYAGVNWCPALGTVLANEEVYTDPEQGLVSERGKHPVVRKSMRQWFLRITAYAGRLLESLDKLDWPHSVREMQRNWIGRSEGALVHFPVAGSGESVPVFTTRPDTIFGATYMVLAPEHHLVKKITTNSQKKAVEEYIDYTQDRTERERLADVKNITGVFTGAYAENPFTKENIPVWIADYVLETYGTGAIMSVPAHDSRDHKFARKFDLPVREVVKGGNIQEEAYEAKEGTMVNSGFLNGSGVPEAIRKAIEKIEEKGLGKREVNYKLRDFLFSRQRYWGEPFPIVFKNGVPCPVSENELPVELPKMNSFKPSQDGEPPLSRVKNWVEKPDGSQRETNTMPGWAGSNWYFLRYMDPHNDHELVNKDKESYWGNVDFYVGGAEHATTHLIYSRFICHFLYDHGVISHPEPFQKLINQGIIQGVSHFCKFDVQQGKPCLSPGSSSVQPVRIPNEFANTKQHRLSQKGLEKLLSRWPNWFGQKIDPGKDVNWTNNNDENTRYLSLATEVEKMSKSKYNEVNPDEVIEEYGTDTFRVYEMFLGPIDQHKPWKMEGIDGAYRFLNKFWRLFFDDSGKFALTSDDPSEEELKILHKTIKNVKDDLEQFSLNTCVSHFMICTNELHKIKCRKAKILEPLVILLSPFAPHITEELWEMSGHSPSVANAPFPKYDKEYLKEDTFEYPVSVNGKLRTKHSFPLDKPKEEIETEVLTLPAIQKWILDKEVRKVIYVKGKIINIVV